MLAGLTCVAQMKHGSQSHRNFDWKSAQLVQSSSVELSKH